MGVIADASQLPRLSDPVAPFSDMANANAVGDEAVQFGNDLRTAGQPPPPVFHSVQYKTNKDGTQDVSIAMPQATLDRIMPLIQTGQAAQQAFALARQQIQAKQGFLEAHPLVAALGRISSTAAAQYSNPTSPAVSPLVRAAGAFGLDYFGKTTDQLAMENAQLAEQQFGIQRQMTSEQQQEAVIQQGAQRLQNEQSFQQQELKLRQGQLDRQDLADATAPYEKIAADGAHVNAADLAKDPQLSAKLTRKQIEDKARVLNATADAVIAARKQDQTMKEDLQQREFKFRANIEFRNRLSLQQTALAGANLQKYNALDEKITEAFQNSTRARAFFASMASSMNQAPPRTAAEAQKLAADWFKVQQAIDPQKAAEGLNMASGLAAQLDVSGKVEALMRAQGEVYKTLPKDLRAGHIGPDDKLDKIDMTFLSMGLPRPTAEQRKAAEAQIAQAEAQKAASGNRNIANPATFSGVGPGAGAAPTAAGTPAVAPAQPGEPTIRSVGNPIRSVNDAIGRFGSTIASLSSDAANSVVAYIRDLPKIAGRKLTDAEIDDKVKSFIKNAFPDQYEKLFAPKK